jgi:hypothetical protein
MPTKRTHTAVITTSEYLIVAGGESGWNVLDTVEVMHIQTLVWSTAASLPHPYTRGVNNHVWRPTVYAGRI